MKGIDIKKIFKKFVQLRDKDKLKMEITPHTDWRMLIIVFVVIVIIVAGASFYIFVQIEKDEIFTAQGDNKPKEKIITASKLKDTINQFEQKKAQLEKLRTERPHIVDPSL